MKIQWEGLFAVNEVKNDFQCFYFVESASNWAWCCIFKASIISSIFPSIIEGKLLQLCLIRWSVTRSCGKLYVRIFSERSPVPIWPKRLSPCSFGRQPGSFGDVWPVYFAFLSPWRKGRTPGDSGWPKIILERCVDRYFSFDFVRVAWHTTLVLECSVWLGTLAKFHFQ